MSSSIDGTVSCTIDVVSVFVGPPVSIDTSHGIGRHDNLCLNFNSVSSATESEQVGLQGIMARTKRASRPAAVGAAITPNKTAVAATPPEQDEARRRGSRREVGYVYRRPGPQGDAEVREG